MSTMPDSTRPQKGVIGGIDTHGDVHVAAVLDEHGRLLATGSFAADAAGYAQLHGWFTDHGPILGVGPDGSTVDRSAYTTAFQGPAEIPGEGTYVEPLAAVDLNVDPGPLEACDVQGVHGDGPRREIVVLVASCAGVGTFAVNLDRTEGRWGLQAGSDHGVEDGPDVVPAGTGCNIHGNGIEFEIVRGSRAGEVDRGVVSQYRRTCGDARWA